MRPQSIITPNVFPDDICEGPRLRAALGHAVDVLRPLIEKALGLAPTLSEPNERHGVGALCMNYLAWRGELRRARALSNELQSGIQSRSTLSSWINFAMWHSTILSLEGENQGGMAALKAVLQVSHQEGFAFADVHFQLAVAMLALNQGDLTTARDALAVGSASLQVWHVSDRAAYEVARATILALDGHAEEAVSLVGEAYLGLSQLPPFMRACGTMLGGWVLLLTGRHAEARQKFYSALEFGNNMPSFTVQYQCLLALAWSHFQSDEEEPALSYLREALAIGLCYDYKNSHPLWLPHVMSDLLARALAAEIEPEYVKRLIRRRGLLPPEDRLEQETWPWPVRIRSLGEFSVHLNDEALLLPARAPKKPLELLKALVALGGRSVSVGSLTQALWPELMGDAATNAFTVALHRLRKLLRQETAIVLSEGKLSLDAQRVWVDVWAFERLVNRLDALARQARGKQETDPNGLAEELLRLYPGHFLGEEDAPWALGSREKLRSKFLRVCAVLSHRLESAKRAEEAIVLNRRALELDPLAEPFYQGLIRNFLALGRTAEALDAYRRCREILSVTLGVEPSAATQALYQSAKRG